MAESLPAAHVAAYDSADEAAARAIAAEVEVVISRIIQQSESLVRRQDIEGILGLNQGLGLALQRPILRAWDNGWILGAGHGITEMQRSVPARLRPTTVSQFALPDDILNAIAALFQFTPETFRNVGAERAVQGRALKLAGNFAKDILDGLKADLLASVMPQPATGNPIGRPELLNRIQRRLGVSVVRAKMIARTETTNAYTEGRLNSFQSSPLVSHLLFASIKDDRRTDICESRHGIVIPVSEKAAIAANTPSLHVSCRSTWSNLMPLVNASHRAMVEDPARLWSNRALVPLPKGWKTRIVV